MKKVTSSSSNISAQMLLEETLHMSIHSWDSEEQKYVPNPQLITKQIELIKKAIADGANISNISFSILNKVHIEIVKLLIENGLPAQAIYFYKNWNDEDAINTLQYAVTQNTKLPLIVTIKALLIIDHAKAEIVNFILNNSAPNQKFNANTVMAEISELGEQFEEYVKSPWNGFIMPMHRFLEFVGSMEHNVTMLHILAKYAKQDFFTQWLEIKSAEIDINALDDHGRTALFYAPTAEIAKLLIKHGLDKEIKDNEGKIWAINLGLGMIPYLIKDGHLGDKHATEMFFNHFIRGNYEHSYKIYKATDVKIDSNAISAFVSAIQLGLHNSVENNKYDSVLSLVVKAGILIPHQYTHLIYNIEDGKNAEEFLFLDGLLHKLAEHYLNIAKNSLNYPPIENEFDAYYQILGKALNKFDNDYAIEVLTINGLPPLPLARDITVFRGMKATLDYDDMQAYFKFGIRAFSMGEYQKFMGYYLNQPWNEVKGAMEIGGTYVSLDANIVTGFTGASEKVEGIMLEMRIPYGSPTICGPWKGEFELVPSTIEGHNIVAIYKLLSFENSRYKITEVIKNPYILYDTIKYKQGDEIITDQQAIDIYDQLECKNIPTGEDFTDDENTFTLYSNYTDFTAKYTYVDLFDKYFADRALYQELFTPDCDLAYMCC